MDMTTTLKDSYFSEVLPCYSEVWAWLSKRIGGAA